ncbi:hypothetical protein AAG570_005026 [Ranatra chinensis]|uniref:ARM repeat superfamily protein n=1 Tax=Ranatra chinensis TaxID=642074 RepID=A0ABD0YHK8_9HEMI
MASKRRNMFYENKKQETMEIGILLFLVLGALSNVPLPTNEVEGKSFLGLAERPNLVKLLLDIVLDLFMLPYGWTSESLPSELSAYSYKRIVANSAFSLAPDKLEQTKLTLLKFLSCGVFAESDILVHVVVASSDSRSSVSNYADLQLRKMIGGLNLDSTVVVMPLYLVFLGCGEGDKKRGPASTRLRLKLLPHMTRAKAVVWPAAIKVLFDSLYGENTNAKLKSLALSFCSSIIHHVSHEELSRVANVILESGLLKLVTGPGGGARAEGGAPDALLLRQAYSVIGQLVARVPAVINKSAAGSLSLLNTLFQALEQETQQDVQLCIRDAMVMMCPAYKSLPDDQAQMLTALLMQMINSRIPKCRFIAVHFISNALPRTAHQLYILLTAATHPDEDVAAEAKKSLYGTSYKSGAKSEDIVLPPFTDLLVLIVEKEAGKPVNPKLHSEILFYLRLCLAHASGAKASLEQVIHPCESSVLIARYLRRLHDKQPQLIVQYLDFINRLLEAEVSVIALSSLLECVGCLPEILSADHEGKLKNIKALLGSTNEEVRCIAAQLVGLMSQGECVDSACEEYVSGLDSGGKDHERLHGSLLAVGHCVERAARRNAYLASPRPVLAVAKYLKNNSGMLVGGACTACGLLGQAAPLPVSTEEKSKLTESLLSIVFDPKATSKVKDRACISLGLLCVGEDFPCREEIIARFIKKIKEVKDIEMNLSIGECIVNAILGPSSLDALDPWSRDRELEASVQGEERAQGGNASAAARANALAENFLNRVLAVCQEPHPSQRQVRPLDLFGGFGWCGG